MTLAELLAGQPIETVPRIALTAEEAAQALGISRRSFHEHVRHELPVIRRGRLRLYPTVAIAKWAIDNAERVLD